MASGFQTKAGVGARNDDSFGGEGLCRISRSDEKLRLEEAEWTSHVVCAGKGQAPRNKMDATRQRRGAQVGAESIRVSVIWVMVCALDSGR